MVSQYEARKLQRDLESELNAKPASAWKCAAGLVAIVVLGLVGTANDDRRDGGAGFRQAGRLESVQQAPAPSALSGKDLDTQKTPVELVRHDQ